jgi:hypothetical protein
VRPGAIGKDISEPGGIGHFAREYFAAASLGSDYALFQAEGVNLVVVGADIHRPIHHGWRGVHATGCVAP